jgi:hypothetical protein
MNRPERYRALTALGAGNPHRESTATTRDSFMLLHAYRLAF